MNKDLCKIISSLDGNVLVIGASEDLLLKIEQNDKVVFCDALESRDSNDSKKKRFKFFRTKRVNINKIRKRYKKKSIDYIVCNYEAIEPYIYKFVRNSVYINKNKLYYFGSVDVSLVQSKYLRYNTKIDIKKYKDNYIVTIDNSSSKNKRIKEIGYSIIDTFSSVVEFIGDILMG